MEVWCLNELSITGSVKDTEEFNNNEDLSADSSLHDVFTTNRNPGFFCQFLTETNPPLDMLSKLSNKYPSLRFFLETIVIEEKVGMRSIYHNNAPDGMTRSYSLFNWKRTIEEFPDMVMNLCDEEDGGEV